MICTEMFDTEENEERSMIEPRSFEEPKLKELIAVLIEWINDELADQRIIVKDIEEDLYDGQVLQKLLGKLWEYGNERSNTLHKLCLMEVYFT
jgi:parvin